MSNFICSECGMTNIDCGGAGYKTPKEIELEKENKLLKEQLKEANILVKMAAPLFGYGSDKIDAELSDFSIYLKKWVVK